ncbi:MAG: leucine-rich repeat protein [Clostridia bacterium]|nr:leucine-rich repeat protein [Clostridia bacterium]
MEGICKTCGEKVYQELERLPHDYDENGSCKTCERNETGYLPPENSDVGFTLSDCYNQSALLGFTYTQEEFLSLVTSYDSNTPIQEFYFNAIGHLRLTVDGYSIDAGNIRENFEYSWQNPLYNVAQIYFSNDNDHASSRVIVVTTDGEKMDYGYLEETFKGTPSEKLLSKFLVNKQNELIFLYSDNTFKKVGVIANEKTDLDSSALIYTKKENGYYVAGAMNQNIQQLIVPETHKGKPVVGIAENAFNDYSNLKTADLSSLNLLYIEYCAFFSSTLSEIILGENIEKIEVYALASKNLTNVTFKDPYNWYTSNLTVSYNAEELKDTAIAASYFNAHKFYRWEKIIVK